MKNYKALYEKQKELIERQKITISYFLKYSGEAERITKFMESIREATSELSALQAEQSEARALESERAAEILVETYGCKDLADLKSCFIAEDKSLTMIIDAMLEFKGREVTNEAYCTCGNPSKEGDCYFEGDEKLIYKCADCGKIVRDNKI